MAELYYFEASPPCRAVALTARMLGIKFCKKNIHLLKGEHMTEEFLAINPEHKIPVFVDEGTILYESRSIMRYLVKKYGKKNDPLYPDDIKKQYEIDRFLDFDVGVLFNRLVGYIRPVLQKREPIDQEKRKSCLEALSYFDTYLIGKKFITGKDFTVADISLVATATQFPIVGIDTLPYPNVHAWIEKCKTTMPYFLEENENCLAEVRQIFDPFFKSGEE